MKKTILTLIVACGVVAAATAAPKPNLWPMWTQSDAASTVEVDHTPWDRFLSRYLVTGDPSGINLMDYASVTNADRQSLDTYIAALEQTEVRNLNRNEQRAFWINLYNALTVQVILDHYPVASIRDVDLSRGLFSSGPWKAKLVEIEGEPVSLDDIEHRILRPIWQDPRIHYAVNCASIGCPNLQPEAYTAANTEELLDRGAREYVNNPRAVSLADGTLTLAAIYDWFSEDFGGEAGVLRHIERYADAGLATAVRSYTGRIRYQYDWTLNETR